MENVVLIGCTKELKNRIKISQGMKNYLNNNPEAKKKRIKQIKNINQENRVQKIKDYYNNLTKEERTMRMKKLFKKIRCIETQQVFNSINEAAQWCGVSSSSISHCLREDQKTAGKHPITKIRLHWEYV